MRRVGASLIVGLCHFALAASAAPAVIPAVIDPPELAGPPKPTPAPPTPAERQVSDSPLLRAALQAPDDLTKLAPAIRELNALLRQEPRNSFLYRFRAILACRAHASP